MSDDLEAILAGEEPESAEEPAAQERPRDEHGRFVAQEQEQGEAPVEPEAAPTGEESVAEALPDEAVSPAAEEPQVQVSDEIAGLKAELARRTEKTRALEQQMQQMQQFLQSQQQQDQPQRPDLFEDPDAALSHIEQTFDQKLQRARIDWSEAAARQRYQDFDDKVTEWNQMATENPAMWEQMRASPDPAEYVYREATRAAKLREIGDISTYEAKVRAEERAKIEAEMNAKIEAEIKKRMELPGSLSDTRATGGNNAPPVTNESLDDILGR